jgi:hypothetical protein
MLLLAVDLRHGEQNKYCTRDDIDRGADAKRPKATLLFRQETQIRPVQRIVAVARHNFKVTKVNLTVKNRRKNKVPYSQTALFQGGKVYRICLLFSIPMIRYSKTTAKDSNS